MEKEREDMCGFLKKKKGSGFFRMFGNTNLRWFVVQYKNKLFGYKNTKTDKILKASHNFSEILDFTTDFPEGEKNMCEWRFGFIVLTERKKYVVYAQSETELKKWTYAFDIILKRVPEAFPMINPEFFRAAIDFIEKPYLREVQQMKVAMEKERIRKEEEKKLHFKQQKEYEENRRKLVIEEAEWLEKIQKQEEYEYIMKQKEDLIKQQLEESLKREKETQIIDKEKNANKLYDIQHESIMTEIDDQILNNFLELIIQIIEIPFIAVN